MNEMVIYPYPYPCKTCLNLCFIRQAIRPNWKLLGFSIGPYGNAESTHYMLIWSSIISLLSWAELSLMYRIWNQSRALWFATRAGAVTTWPTCDNPLFTLNCQNYIWLEMTLSEWKKIIWLQNVSNGDGMTLIVQSHNHTDPHSQVLFPVVNEDT